MSIHYFKSTNLEHAAIDLVRNGWEVYYHIPKSLGPVSWLYFYKPDIGIGYVQHEDLRGTLSYSSCHKPCTNAGSGYSVIDGVAEHNDSIAEQAASCFCPSWAHRDSKFIKKYSSFEEYQRRNPILQYTKLQLEEEATNVQ